jgi:prefoldin subunit 5
MDSINGRNFELLNEHIKNLQNTITQLNNTNTELNNTNTQLNNTNTQLNNTNEVQENIIYETSVRTNISNKMLHILKTKDDK